MNFHPVTIFAPIQDPQNPGEVILDQREIQINLGKVFFIFKKPLIEQTEIVTLAGPVVTSSPPSEDILEAAGLVPIEATEGATEWFRPDKVELYLTPELGTYVLVFPGGSRLGVKTTHEELRQKLGISEGIIL